MNNKFYFEQDGHLKLEAKFNDETFKGAIAAFKLILKKSQNELYKKIRVYDDYFFKINVSGIENVFDEKIIHQDILNLINESNIVDIAKSILQENELILHLNRYHVTDQATHLGIWHRDSEHNSTESVQINIYLFDEIGMEIVNNSHKREDLPKETLVMKSKPYSSLENTSHISAKAKNIIAFNPSLIHRGKTLKKRAHLHFRFTKKKALPKLIDKSSSLSYLDTYKIEKNLKDLLIESAKYGYLYNIEDYVRKKNFKENFLRIFRYGIHKFLFFLEYDNKIYLKFSVRPCLIIRKFFRLK